MHSPSTTFCDSLVPQCFHSRDACCCWPSWVCGRLCSPQMVAFVVETLPSTIDASSWRPPQPTNHCDGALTYLLSWFHPPIIELAEAAESILQSAFAKKARYEVLRYTTQIIRFGLQLHVQGILYSVHVRSRPYPNLSSTNFSVL